MAEHSSQLNGAPARERASSFGRNGAVMRCGLIGPRGAGKSALLLCLRQHGAVTHSFGERFSVEVSDPARLEGSVEALAAQAPGWFFSKLFSRNGDAPSRRRDRRMLAAPEAGSPSDALVSMRESAFRRDHDADAAVSQLQSVNRYALEIDQAVRAGLRLDPTGDRIDHLALTLALRPLAGRLPGSGRRTRRVRLDLIDAGGDVLAGEPADALRRDLERVESELVEKGAGPSASDAASRRRRKAARAYLLTQLPALDALVLCLPMADGPMPQPQRRALQDLLRWVEANGGKRLKTIIVAATQYERVFEDAGPHAYRQAATRDVALDRLQLRFETIWSDLAPALADFNAAPRRRVLVQPVSAFGFVPYHGGANVDPTDGGLRTRAPARPGDPRDAAAPYAFDAVQNHYWSPFLTLDPFVTLAAEEFGALTFAFEDVAPEARYA